VEVKEAVDERRKGWRRKGKAILWEDRVYILDSLTLREEIISRHHDQELAVWHLSNTWDTMKLEIHARHYGAI